MAQHLSDTLRRQSFLCGKLAGLTGQRWPIVGRRIHQEFPYIDAEVRYAVKEYAATAVDDVIARRLRLSFLNVQAAEERLTCGGQHHGGRVVGGTRRSRTSRRRMPWSS